jgi:hypothetical protein
MKNNFALKIMLIIFHGIGLGCLGAAICFQLLVFTTILQNGYFRAVESNSAILYGEIALTDFSAAYFIIYVYQLEIREHLKSL